MGIPVSLILIAVGAVLAFAVHQTSNAAVNVHVVGWIILAVGVVGLLLALAWWERWGPGYWGWHRSAYDAPPGDGAYGRGYGRGYGQGRGYGRRRIVEEDVESGAPPGPGPYDAPPPP